MVNSLFTVVSERTVSTTKHYNVTESFLRQSFYPYADCDVKPVQPGAGQDGDEPKDDIPLHSPRLAVHHERMNDKGVFRTAPATPGLLNIT